MDIWRIMTIPTYCIHKHTSMTSYRQQKRILTVLADTYMTTYGWLVIGSKEACKSNISEQRKDDIYLALDTKKT